MDVQNEISRLCLEKYNSLKKTGKPSEKEWTVLSGIVLENTEKKFSILSLCTGTKCLGGSELKDADYCARGCKLSDSHAEILARRAFLRYLYHQIEVLIDKDKSDIFFLEENSIKLKKVSFHFFSSQSPCGDCSIIPKLNKEVDNFESPSKKIKKENTNDETEYGMEILDIHRTGAKCLENCDKQDLHQQGVFYHTVGALRTKPGRGDRTLSLSCSDKIAKWQIMGIQGALLSLMVPSIHLSSITIGGGCPYSFESMQRGLYKRFNYKLMEPPKIMQSEHAFNDRKGGVRLRPCPSSVVWCAVPENSIEIAVDGLKQGATKKKKNSCRLLISRKEIFKTFLRVYQKFSKNKLFPRHPKKLSYYHCKQYSTKYQNKLKENSKVFLSWPVKPLYLQEFSTF